MCQSERRTVSRCVRPILCACFHKGEIVKPNGHPVEMRRHGT